MLDEQSFPSRSRCGRGTEPVKLLDLNSCVHWQSLFRPVTMVYPDLDLIATNLLLAEGFSCAHKLAPKVRTMNMLVSRCASYALRADHRIVPARSPTGSCSTTLRLEPEGCENSPFYRWDYEEGFLTCWCGSAFGLRKRDANG